MKAKELDENTWLITRGEGQSSIHNYLLVGEHKAALIDTGLEEETLQAFVSLITDKPIVVIHTHGHIDHIGNDQQFEEVMLHPRDVDLYHLHSSAEFRREFFKRQYEEMKQNDPDKAEAFAIKQFQTINQTVALKPLTEGMVVDLGTRKLKVIETPGHTQGCISLVDVDKKVIYTGDMVCEMGVLMHFAEATTINVYKQSLEVIYSAMTPEYRLFSGHQLSPLTIEWVEKYLECVSELIELGKTSDLTNQSVNEILFYSKENAKISYRNDQLLDGIRETN